MALIVLIRSHLIILFLGISFIALAEDQMPSQRNNIALYTCRGISLETNFIFSEEQKMCNLMQTVLSNISKYH